MSIKNAKISHAFALVLALFAGAASGAPTADERDFQRGEELSRQGDLKGAYSAYRSAADAGNRRAMVIVGSMYFEGHGVAKDDVEAARWLKKAAKARSDEAQFNLGMMYHEGLGVAKDEAEAVKLLLEAGYHSRNTVKLAGQGETNAMVALAWMYMSGRVPRDDNSKKPASGYSWNISEPPNREKAMLWFNKAAEKGSVVAKRELAVINASGWFLDPAKHNNVQAAGFYSGLYGENNGLSKNDAQAIAWLMLSANATNNIEAMFDLSKLYQSGIGVERNDREAIRWLMNAVKTDHETSISQLESSAANNPAAMAVLGLLRRNDKNYNKAMDLFRKSASAGQSMSMEFLARMYAEGLGVEKNEAEALRWLRRAAEAGNASAMGDLGGRYLDGQGVAKNNTEALRWLRGAAEAGEANAMYRLGRMCQYGLGLPKNEDLAMTWLWGWVQKAGNNGGKFIADTSSKNDVVAMLMMGQVNESQKNYPESLRLYRRAADTGSPRGMSMLGNLYVNGLGVQQSNAEAMRLFRKAADAGDAYAMGMIGSMYFDGLGIAKDQKEAAHWHHKAAAAGNAASMYSLGQMYQNGNGVVKDEGVAANWFLKSLEANKNSRQFIQTLAKQGDTVAMVALGLKSQNEKNYTEAFDWYVDAAAAENGFAMYSIGNMYLNGWGVPADKDRARTWYEKAAKRGLPGATEALKMI